MTSPNINPHAPASNGAVTAGRNPSKDQPAVTNNSVVPGRGASACAKVTALWSGRASDAVTTNFMGSSSMVELPAVNRTVAGSNPAFPATNSDIPSELTGGESAAVPSPDLAGAEPSLIPVPAFSLGKSVGDVTSFINSDELISWLLSQTVRNLNRRAVNEPSTLALARRSEIQVSSSFIQHPQSAEA